MINPFWWLAMLVAALIAVRFFRLRAAHHVATQLSAVARQARMNYSALDRFDLATRLQRSFRWTAGVRVTDVIYGASAGERRFVATVAQRATADDRPVFVVVACIERLDDGAFRTVGEAMLKRKPGDVAAAYRAAVTLLVPSPDTPGEG